MLLALPFVAAALSHNVPYATNVPFDTPRDVHLCEHYYIGDPSECKAMRAQVQARRRFSCPTLELGDPSRPPMLFFHGFPSSSALWANQFKHFCYGDNAPFFCIAPSWIDFHPDLPKEAPDPVFQAPNPMSDYVGFTHRWMTQVERFGTLVEEMHLSNITLVMHDFGSILGYIFAYKYSSRVRAVVSFDIGLGMGPLPGWTEKVKDMSEYQQVNVNSYLTHNDSMLQIYIAGDRCTPCGLCQVAPGQPSPGPGHLTAWPYTNFLMTPHDKGITRLAPNLSLRQWQHHFIPFWPDHIPIYLIYAECNEEGFFDQCTKNARYWETCTDPPKGLHSDAFLDWLDARRDGSSYDSVRMGHWIPCRGDVNATNAKVDAWLHSINRVRSRHSRKRTHQASNVLTASDDPRGEEEAIVEEGEEQEATRSVD